MTGLSIVARDHVKTIPAAISALEDMRREIAAAKTYDEIKKVRAVAVAIKSLHGDIAVVRRKAEDVILEAEVKIGEEVNKLPSERGRRRTTRGPSSGRTLVDIPSSTRKRFQKLAAAKPKLEAIKTKIRENGNGVSVNAVLREIAREARGAEVEARTTRIRGFNARVAQFLTKTKEYLREVQDAHSCRDKFSPEAFAFTCRKLEQLEAEIGKLKRS